jgi:hypothetical protein
MSSRRLAALVVLLTVGASPLIAVQSVAFSTSRGNRSKAHWRERRQRCKGFPESTSGNPRRKFRHIPKKIEVKSDS